MKRGHGVLIREVEIDYTQNWVNIHLRSLESAYRNAPYFEYYQDYFWKVFKKKHRYLFDLNLELMTVCLQLLGIKKKIELTADFVREADEQTDDVRSLIHPKRTNPRGYITWPAYTQVFGSEFVSNLSILDLLFNEGPDSVKLLARGESLIK